MENSMAFLTTTFYSTGRKSQHIALKTSFSKFTNDKSTTIMLDVPIPDEPVPKFVAYNGKRLLPRSTPSNLHSWITVMNKAQRQTVTQMGFQSLLNLKVQNIPTSLLLWLVKKNSYLVEYVEDKDLNTLESHLVNNKPSWMKAEKDVKRKRSKKKKMLCRRKKTETNEKLLEREWYIIGEEEEKETKDDEQHGKNEDKEDDEKNKELEWHKDCGDELNEDSSGNHLLIHVVSQYERSQSSKKEDEGESEYEIDEHDEDDVDLGGDDEEESEDDDEEESEDGPSEETETDEDVQSGKGKKEKKIEYEQNASTQHVVQYYQVSPTPERMMSKSITGDDVGEDDVTIKAPIFDETPHTSNIVEDKSSQSDFTASMMIEYEIKEAKMLMVSNPTFDETPQTNKPSMEENSQSDFTSSMIVEYDQQKIRY
ncbi:hypothetical protein L1987_01735 [Smallanthus sonchifolius]|uniref:Uncharacterized protein n=1 Tax=Smallanthus sonchifolius TaxID=185202 RepID=A0ACB9K5T1_9ASTR|nr:hypothetical protein L1987_01735 [Smallanthus sonchifolius]